MTGFSHNESNCFVQLNMQRNYFIKLICKILSLLIFKIKPRIKKQAFALIDT